MGYAQRCVRLSFSTCSLSHSVMLYLQILLCARTTSASRSFPAMFTLTARESPQAAWTRKCAYGAQNQFSMQQTQTTGHPSHYAPSPCTQATVLTVRWAHSGRWLASSGDEIIMIWDLDPHVSVFSVELVPPYAHNPRRQDRFWKSLGLGRSQCRGMGSPQRLPDHESGMCFKSSIPPISF